MHKKDFLLGALIGAAAGAIAGVLFAPKSGKETRQDIKNYMSEMKNKIAEEISRVGKLTKEKYQTIVDDVVDSYSEEDKVTEDEAKMIKRDLKDSYEKIRDVLGR